MNIHVDRHDKKGREEILKVHLKNVKTEENLDIDTFSVSIRVRVKSLILIMDKCI